MTNSVQVSPRYDSDEGDLDAFETILFMPCKWYRGDDVQKALEELGDFLTDPTVIGLTRVKVSPTHS